MTFIVNSCLDTNNSRPTETYCSFTGIELGLERLERSLTRTRRYSLNLGELSGLNFQTNHNIVLN